MKQTVTITAQTSLHPPGYAADAILQVLSDLGLTQIRIDIGNLTVKQS